MLYPSHFLKSSLFFSSHLAMLVISTSTTVVACGEVRLLRTICPAIARRMRLGVTISMSSPAMLGAAGAPYAGSIGAARALYTGCAAGAGAAGAGAAGAGAAG